METKLWTGLHINTLVSSESALHGQNMHSNRENMQGGEKTKLWRKLFAEIIHFPPFLCFPYADTIPLPFPSLFLSLSLFSSCTFHSILHISDSPPFHYTSPLLNTTCPPHSLFFSVFFATSFPPSPHYLTLWLDAQWVTPLLKSSEMEGEGREQKKEIVREREKAGENDREKNIENKNGRRES